MGALFTWLLGDGYLRARTMSEWPQVECVILESGVEKRQIGEAVPVDYRFGVLYGYEFEGERYTSERYDARGAGWTKNPDKLVGVLAQFKEGSSHRCWVNPEEPSFSILKLDTRAPGYSIWFPMLFLVGGVGVVFSSLWKLVRPRG